MTAQFASIARAIPPKRGGGRPPKDERERAVPPTPETEAKKRPDHISRLREELWSAAIDIDRAYCMICAHVMSRSSNLEPRTGKGVEAPLDPNSKPAKLLYAYRDWQTEMTRRHLPIAPVIDMVVEGMAPSEVDWRTHHQAGWAAERLLEALDLYVGLGR